MTTTSLLNRTRVILHHPSLPENVGAIARSMRHFGLSELILVGGVSPIHPLALATSAGNEMLLHAARQHDTLDEALAGASLVFGTTARGQHRPDRCAITPREAAQLAHAHNPHGAIALLLGTEKHGLSNAELLRTDQIVTIPGVPDTCLNLAHALTILAYEWHTLTPPSTTAVPLNQITPTDSDTTLAELLITLLTTRGLLKGRQMDSKRHTLRRILTRTLLTPDEAAMITGWLQALCRQSP